ncbi:MAG: hypothetical protein ABGX87_01025 [Alcanivorax sp.]|uniref:hypothetical protein n=1 Tax=Alloalcanivorax marinus TaxID=1177169 RepID=UPI00195622CB|nr:hypothetical protein [Alloalcanivorax marinus]MBM7332994.1 hypothetical protein [Alloalcanivorax marinus]
MTSEQAPQNKGPIVFLGSTNAMPMVYARALKRLGHEVLYFVGRRPTDTLHRPENHFPDIDYPYPEWIVEMPVSSQVMLATFPRYYAARIGKEVRKRSGRPPVCYILNGFYIALHPYLEQQAIRIGLSHGADLIQWGDPENKAQLVRDFSKKTVFRFLPSTLSSWWIGTVLKRQAAGFASIHYLIAFLRGISHDNDRLVRRYESQGVRYIPRFDVSFDPLSGEPRGFKPADDFLSIFCGVRFHYKSMVGNRKGWSKGNDQIIRGLADFYREYPAMRVHFVEKGPDVQSAKALCAELGLDCVIWHKEMPFSELLTLYRDADICFDQTGDHWIGAIGAYALWLGKPLIANDRNLVSSGFWPETTPVFTATDSAQVFERLQELRDPRVREAVAAPGQRFAEEYLSSERVVAELDRIVRTADVQQP